MVASFIPESFLIWKRQIYRFTCNVSYFKRWKVIGRGFIDNILTTPTESHLSFCLEPTLQVQLASVHRKIQTNEPPI